MGYNNLWKLPKDMISPVYSNVYGKKKVKKQKQPKRNKSKERNKKNRELLLNYFGLHQYATNIAICHAISDKFNWPMPEQKNQQTKFMRKAISQLTPKPERKYFSRFKTSEDFYKSQQWKDLRYIALKQANGCCQLCGARAADGVQIHVDHIKPRSRYPQYELDLNNLQVLCEDCNFGKSNVDETNWKQHWESI